MSKCREHSKNLQEDILLSLVLLLFILVGTSLHILYNRDHSYISQVTRPDIKVDMFLPSLGNFQTILPPLLFSDSPSLVQANDFFVDNIHQGITLVVLGFKGAFLE